MARTPLSELLIPSRSFTVQNKSARKPVTIDHIKRALQLNETRGRANPYFEKSDKPTRREGGRLDWAYGKYQVMGDNIPSWTKEALGYSLTPAQFLRDPIAQEKVVSNKVKQYMDRYKRPEQVASVWFSGRPLEGNTSRDVFGTSVPEYISDFMKNLNEVQSKDTGIAQNAQARNISANVSESFANVAGNTGGLNLSKIFNTADQFARDINPFMRDDPDPRTASDRELQLRADYLESPFGQTVNTIQNIPRATGTVAREIGQGIGRSLASIGTGIGDAGRVLGERQRMGLEEAFSPDTVKQAVKALFTAEMTPSNKFEEVFTGREQGEIVSLQQEGYDTLTGFGMNEIDAKKFALPLGILIGGLDAFPPVGGSRRGLQEAVETIARTGDLKVIKNALRGLNLADDVVEEVAPRVQILERPQDVLEELARVADTRLPKNVRKPLSEALKPASGSDDLPQTLRPLAEEARKYNSEPSTVFAPRAQTDDLDSFIEAHTVFHGGDAKFINKLKKDKSFVPDAQRDAGTGGNRYGLSTSTDFQWAKDFSTSSTGDPAIAELYIDPRAKTLLLRNREIDDLTEQQTREIAEYFDVIRDVDNAGGESEVRILNDRVLRDRDQIESYFDLVESGVIKGHKNLFEKTPSFRRVPSGKEVDEIVDPVIAELRRVQGASVDDATADLINKGFFDDLVPEMSVGKTVDEQRSIFKEQVQNRFDIDVRNADDPFREFVRKVREGEMSKLSDGLVDDLSASRRSIEEATEEIAKMGKREQVEAEVFMEMDLSRRGFRFSTVDEQGFDVWQGVKSTFPDWVSSDLRRRNLFDKVQDMILKGEEPTKGRAKRLFDEYQAEVRERLGLPADQELADSARLTSSLKKIRDSKFLPEGVGGRGVRVTGDEPPRAISRAKSGAEPPRKITKSEDVLLRDRLRAEARGSKAGFKEGERVTKEQLVNEFRKSQRTIEELRTQVVDYVKDVVPKEAQGKFLQALRKQNINRKKAFSLLERADRVAEQVRKSKLISDLEDMKIPKRGNENIAVDYQKKINSILEGFDFKKPTEKTIKKLSSLAKYLDENREVLNIQPHLLNQVERLSKIPLRDMSASELKELKQTVEKLHNLGRLKSKMKNKYNARIREKNLKELVASSENIDVVEPTRSHKRLSDVRRWQVEAHNAYMNSVHAPRVFDRIDGFQGYKGANAKLGKRLMRAEELTHEMREGRMGTALERLQKLGVEEVGEEDMFKVTLDLMHKQKAMDQVRVLIDEYGKQYGIQDITDLKLTPAQQKMAQVAREVAGERTPVLASVAEEVQNVPFKQVDNYFPIKYEKDFSTNPSDAIRQDRHLKVSAEQGFTKQRQKGVKKVPRIDFLNVLDQSVGEQEWFIHLQPELDDIKSLVFSDEYAQSAGERARLYWKEYLDAVAGRGWSSTAQANWALRKGRHNINNAVLGYKATTILVQPFAVFDAMAYAQSRYGARASMDILFEMGKTWIRPKIAKEMLEKSPALRQRAGGEVAIMEELSATGRSSKAYDKFKRGAMKLIQESDVRTAGGVQRGFEKILKREGIDNPVQEAEFLMNLTQGSASVTTRPLVLSKGELRRTFFTFQTFFLNRWGIIAHDLIKGGVMQKGAKKKLNALIGLGIMYAGTIAEDWARENVMELVRGQSFDDDQSLVKRALLFIPEHVPYFGNIVKTTTMFGRPDSSPPVLRAFEDAIGGTMGVFTKEDPDARLRSGIRGARGAVSVFGGVPATYQGAELLQRFLAPTSSGSISEDASALPSLPESSLPELPKLPQLPSL